MGMTRFLPLLTPFFSWILLEAYVINYRLIYFSVVLLLLLFFYTIKSFLRQTKIKESVFGLLLLPSYYTVGLVAFSTMIASSFWVHFLFVVNAIFLHFYFSIVYNYLINCDKYKKGTLENYSAHGNFLSMYFIASSIYGLQSLVSFSVVYLVSILLLFVAAMVYQVMWVNKIEKRISQIYILIFVLVVVELAWVLWFLTLSFYILGLLLALYYYVLIGLIRFYLVGNFKRDIVKLYLIFGLSSILIVLLTARWF